jgi:hypothetical protein
MSRRDRIAAGIARKFEDDLRARTPRDRRRLESVRRVRTAVTAARGGQPPVDLLRLATRLGVADIQTVPLEVNGRVVQSDATTVIELNDKLDPFRSKVVLAHELAHVVLGPRPEEMSYREFEEVCDECAREILVPHEWLRQRLDPFAPSLTALAEAAAVSRCELDFVFRSAARAGLATFKEVFWCSVATGQPVVVESWQRLRPRDPTETTELSVIEQPSGVLTRALQQPGVTRGTIELWRGQDRTEVTVDCVCSTPEVVLAVRI